MTTLHTINEEQPVFHLMQLFDLDDLNPGEIDAIEIHPCATYTDTAGIEFTEQCGPDEAQFYAVFFRRRDFLEAQRGQILTAFFQPGDKVLGFLRRFPGQRLIMSGFKLLKQCPENQTA